MSGGIQSGAKLANSTGAFEWGEGEIFPTLGREASALLSSLALPKGQIILNQKVLIELLLVIVALLAVVILQSYPAVWGLGISAAVYVATSFTAKHRERELEKLQKEINALGSRLDQLAMRQGFVRQ